MNVDRAADSACRTSDDDIGCVARQTESKGWLRFPKPSQHEFGQAAVEYVVVCAAITLALGIAMSDDDSVLWQVLSAFKMYYRKFSYALSLPN